MIYFQVTKMTAKPKNYAIVMIYMLQRSHISYSIFNVSMLGTKYRTNIPA